MRIAKLKQTTFLFFGFGVLIFQLSFSQNYQLSDISFNDAVRDLSIPFAGGLRAPQFNTVDLNLDGLNDIVIFDREGNVIIPLIRREDGSLIFDPTFRSIFPEFNSWVLFRDYNDDGIKDIFCAPITVGIPGVQVYTGKVTNGLLSYELLEFPQYDFDILYYPAGTTVVQIYVSPADIPEVIDIDKDGDLDILAFEPAGSTIFYFQNMTIEWGLPMDQLEYRVGSQCYGGVFESGFSEMVTLSTELGTCASALWEPEDALAEIRHAGSTVTSYDFNGDGLEDLLLGDVSYDGIVNLNNSGTQEIAWMTDQVLRFPALANEAVDIELFVTSTFGDFDGDGSDEFIAAPNSRSGSQGRDHIWLYDLEKSGDSISNYNLVSKNYLVDEMIYTGTMSSPIFFDYNQDGLMDLLIGTAGRSPDGISIDPRMILYENIGTAEAPSFVRVNNDYINMSQFSTTSRHFAPALGDIDGDSDTDMVIGDETGRLYVVFNTSSQPDQYAWSTPQYDLWGIRVSAWAKPIIIDWNEDGLGDLIVGEQNFNSEDGVLGSLNYFENQGSARNPLFNPDVTLTPNSPILGQVFTRQSGFINNYSAPAILDVGDRQLLAVGTEKGNIFLYDSLSNVPGAIFQAIDNNLGGIREGNISVPAFADLDNDKLMEVAIGTRRGGLAIYETDIQIDFGSSTSTPQIPSEWLALSPNPADTEIRLQLSEVICHTCPVEIWTTAGQLVGKELMTSARMDLDISDLTDGIYFIQLKTLKGIITRKFIKTANY